MQNLGLISGSGPGNAAFAAPQTPERSDSPLALQQRGMVFVRPVSPMPVHQSVPAHPVTLLSVQQVEKKTHPASKTRHVAQLPDNNPL